MEVFALKQNQKLSLCIKLNSNEESLAVARIVSSIRWFQRCPGKINRVFFLASGKRRYTLGV